MWPSGRWGRLGRTVAIETDGRGRPGERHHGAGRGARCVAYITVGTGVGVGVVCGGRVLHGAVHPEAGHLRAALAPAAGRPGVCAFHGDLEGRIAGPSLAARYGVPAPSLGDDHPAWEDVEHKFAHLAHALRCVASPTGSSWVAGCPTAGPRWAGRGPARPPRWGLRSPALTRSAVQMAACDGQQALLGALSLLRRRERLEGVDDIDASRGLSAPDQVLQAKHGVGRRWGDRRRGAANSASCRFGGPWRGRDSSSWSSSWARVTTPCGMPARRAHWIP